MNVRWKLRNPFEMLTDVMNSHGVVVMSGFSMLWSGGNTIS